MRKEIPEMLLQRTTDKNEKLKLTGTKFLSMSLKSDIISKLPLLTALYMLSLWKEM